MYVNNTILGKFSRRRGHLFSGGLVKTESPQKFPGNPGLGILREFAQIPCFHIFYLKLPQPQGELIAMIFPVVFFSGSGCRPHLGTALRGGGWLYRYFWKSIL